jgi:hypothetical protein
MITRQENEDLRSILARAMKAQVDNNLKDFAINLVVLDEYLELITEPEEEPKKDLGNNVTPFNRKT